MSYIKINQEKAAGRHAELSKLCAFGAIESVGDALEINSACRMCRMCIKKAADVFEFVEENAPVIDKSLWRGIAVAAEVEANAIHPVTLELLGKAQELAKKVDHPVYALLMGYNVKHLAQTLLEYGADEVLVYDQIELEHFRIEPFTAAAEDFIDQLKPSVLLVGGTPIGRALAPRLAARFRTGLTADCTVLDISENTDLDQIRPAYGGNIMAHINTPRHRPQLATVRYKIFSIPEKRENPSGKVRECKLSPEKLISNITVLESRAKSREIGIEDAEVLIVAGRGVKKAEDIAMLEELAGLLNGKVACTRAVVEAGWLDAKKQIGLSGRSVKPQLIITCGVSGAIQFVAGMSGADKIIAINNDPAAQIFNVAHVALHGDLYEIVPRLIEQIKNSSGGKK